MSTILDALKKSEQERKLNKLPTLSDMQAPQESARWPLVLSIILGVVSLVAIALAVYWWQAKSSAPVVAPKPANSGPAAVQESIAEENVIDADDIVVNVVSYSDQIAQRFAMINGKVVREGEFAAAGLIVEEIKLDAVVLNLRGKKITRKP